MSYYLAVRTVLDLDSFARLSGLHPDLVQRFVTLGILEARTGADGELQFDRDQVKTVARIRRLRAGFALNYAALGLVLELLDRIDDLERRAQPRTPQTRTTVITIASPRSAGGTTWT